MNCQQVNNLIWDYCDGLLSPDIKAELENHLHECETCSELIRLTLLENEGLKDLPEKEVSDNFTSRLMLNIPSPGNGTIVNLSQPGRQRKFVFGPFTLIGAIAALLIMCFGFWPDLIPSHNKIALDTGKGNKTNEQVIQQNRAKSKAGVGGLENNFAGPEYGANNYSTDGTVLKAADEAKPKPQPDIETAVNQDAPAANPTESTMVTAGTTENIKGINNYQKRDIFPLPGNLPDTYQLMESAWENGTRVLVYTIAGTENTLRISLTAVDGSATASSAASRALKSEQVLEGSGAQVPVKTNKDLAANTVTRDLSFNDVSYKMTLQANIDTNDLVNLANQIELKADQPVSETQP